MDLLELDKSDIDGSARPLPAQARAAREATMPSANGANAASEANGVNGQARGSVRAGLLGQNGSEKENAPSRIQGAFDGAFHAQVAVFFLFFLRTQKADQLHLAAFQTDRSELNTQIPVGQPFPLKVSTSFACNLDWDDCRLYYLEQKGCLPQTGCLLR